MTDFVVESLDPRTIAPADADAIHRLRGRVWPGASADGFLADPYKSSWREYHGPDAQAPAIFVIRQGSEMIALAKTLPRIILPNGQAPLEVMGLASVCSAPAMRGKGLGKAVVRAALARVDRGDFTWAVFQCPPARKTFYEHLGVRQAHNRFARTDGAHVGENPFWDECALRYPDREGWPDGEIGVPSPGW